MSKTDFYQIVFELPYFLPELHNQLPKQQAVFQKT